MFVKKKKKRKRITLSHFLGEWERMDISEREINGLINNILGRRLVQDGGVEGHVLTPSCKSTVITTNC